MRSTLKGLSTSSKHKWWLKSIRLKVLKERDLFTVELPGGNWSEDLMDFHL